jgi:hypothetical protein
VPDLAVQAPTADVLIHVVLAQAPIDHLVTRAAVDRAPQAPIVRAPIHAAAIPLPHGLQPAPDGRLPAADVRSPALGVRDLGPAALALIAPSLLTAVRRPTLALQHPSRNLRTLTLISSSLIPNSRSLMLL